VKQNPTPSHLHHPQMSKLDRRLETHLNA